MSTDLDPSLRFSRTRRLLGDEALDRLKRSRVLLFGLGGVGGACAEALVRCGVGHLTLVDSDTVAPSNLNRQVFATCETVGMDKTEAALKRLRAIWPECGLEGIRAFVLPENIGMFDFAAFDYAVDCVDTVSAKMAVIEAAKRAGTPVISCMGTGNKLDPTQLKAADIYETSVCPLARAMRALCRKRGIPDLRVVYSTEPPRTPAPEEEDTARRGVPASVSFVPPAAGLILAAEVVRGLTGDMIR